MKYPQLVSTPAVVKEWLEAELECLGIDSAAYARTVLSLLSRDTIDPAEVIQSGYVLVANKCGRGSGGPNGSHPPRTREEELKRAEVIECLRSASEDHCGIQLLVDQLISMLKQLPASDAVTSVDTIRRSDAAEPPAEDPVLRYEAAFPALSRESPGVIPLTYFSKMSRAPAKPPAVLSSWPAVGGGRAATSADLWHSADNHPTTAVWPTVLNLSLLLQPAGLDGARPPAAADWPARLCSDQLSDYTSLSTASLEPAAPPPPPPPKPPEPAAGARSIQPSAETHFQPIRRASDGDDDPAEWPPPATYDARLYTRSDSGGLYLEDEPSPSAADRPQKYMVYHETTPGAAPSRGLAPKFKLSCNEKYCQTDAAAPGEAAANDLLQILVFGEQRGAARCADDDPDDDDDDDSSYEVLSSLQQTLHSIYEDGSEAAADDSGAEPEPLSGSEEPEQPAERGRRPSAFARVRRPSAGHRPLYMRGGGADSLLAEVYTGGAWSPDGAPPEPDHRPLYARQPAATAAAAAAAAAGYAEHRQLSSGRISGAVYRQGPTEYPALRYQLAGRDLPEVTFCRLTSDAHSAATRKDESTGSGEVTAWDSAVDELRASRESSTVSDAAPWPAGGERKRRDRSADRALWQTDRSADRALWQTDADAAPADTAADQAIWQAPADPAQREDLTDTAIWKAARIPVEFETSAEKIAWEASGDQLLEAEKFADKNVWESSEDGIEGENASEKNVWELSGGVIGNNFVGKNAWELSVEVNERENSAEKSLWDSSGDLFEREISVEKSAWDSSGAPSLRDKSVDGIHWESRDLTQREISAEESLWEPRSDPVQRRLSFDEAVWESRSSGGEREEPADRTLWESRGDLTQLETSIDTALWESRAGRSGCERAVGDTPWESGGEPAPPERPAGKAAGGAGWARRLGRPWEPDLIRPPERIWRRAEPADETGPPAQEGQQQQHQQQQHQQEQQQQMRRLLWRLGGDDVLAQTGLFPADELADRDLHWEFIDENNVKNKIDKSGSGEGGPLASELADVVPGWRVLPALRQLSECLGLTEGRPLPDGVALKAWALEEQWRRDDGPPRPARDRRPRRSDRKRPCSFFMEGNCKRNDCKFSHDLSAITCVFWEESGCFKGVTCPFLHGYPPPDDEDEDSSDSAKRTVPKKSFKLEKEDFPTLHNMKKWRKNDEEDSRRPGRRSCRRHKSFSDATLGLAGGEPELHRAALGGRGKRRRHHSKSEGVRPADAGARRP